LYDGIEFSDSFRYADVAEDIAYLSMDLIYHKREDPQTRFTKDYVSRSKHYSLENILDFRFAAKHLSGKKFPFFKQVRIV